MTYTTHLDSAGRISLSPYAERGFASGQLVEVIPTSAGSLIIVAKEEPLAYDAVFRALEGGAAQLVARRAARKALVDDGIVKREQP